MTVNLQVTYRDFPAPVSAEERIGERVERLERIFPRIVTCRVVVEHVESRQKRGKLYQFRLDLSVPGSELVVNQTQNDNHAHEDFYVAMRDAFDALERQLKKHAAKSRGDVKAHETPPHGVIARMFPDYGFIAAPDGLEIYFHANSLVEGSFEKLNVGDEVRFVLAEGEGEKGPQASTVHPVGKHHPV